MNYYRLHIGDYLRDAAHLSLLEHGVYARLLQVYYTREQPIADSEKYRVVGARTQDERDAVDVVLAEFFVLGDDGWRQSRCDREIAAYQQKAERNREVGALGGRPPKARNPEETQMVSTSNPTETLASSQEPREEKEQEKESRAPRRTPPPQSVACPSDVDEAHWRDWLAARKAKRGGAVTATALDGMRREAAKAGIALGEAVRIAAERSWVAFSAGYDWRPSARAAGPPRQSAAATERQTYLAGLNGAGTYRPTDDPRTIDVDQLEPAAPRLAFGGR